MVHLLSERHRSEFLAVPQLARLTVGTGSDGDETTLLIKANSLALKYLVRLRRFRVVLFRVEPCWLGYGVEVQDDPDHPSLIWSIAEDADEVAALSRLAVDPACTVYLFNEAVVPVAWSTAQIDLSSDDAQSLLRTSVLADEDDTEPTSTARAFLASLKQYPGSVNVVTVAPPELPVWSGIHSTYLTNSASRSSLSIFDEDEGTQQEEIGLWLTDNLQAIGTIKSPQIHRNGKRRELTDLLLSHEYGAFLIESKTLGLRNREPLPSRAELANDLVGDLRKAMRQLRGALRWLRQGHPITDMGGALLEVERAAIPHVIVLVPDVSLLAHATEFGGPFIVATLEEAKAFVHILDPAELLRVVQAAGEIARNSKALTPLMAFDWYLMERAKRAVTHDTPAFGVLFRWSQDSADSAVA